MAESAAATTAPSLPLRPPKGCPFGIDPAFAEWREHQPVAQVRMPDDATAWLLTRHADIRRMLRSQGVSANPDSRGFPVGGAPGRRTKLVLGSLLRKDAPDHARLRRLVTREFMPKRARALRGVLVDRARQLCGELGAAGPGADFVSHVAEPLTSDMMNELLGVPEVEGPRLLGMVGVASSLTMADEDMERRLEDAASYFQDLIDDKRANPGDDTLSRLIHHHDQGDALSDDELVSLAWLLVMAGYDTTAHSIALSVLLLAERPELVAQLRSDPGLYPNAVEEFLRFTTVARTGPRRALVDDHVVQGKTLAAGEGVVTFVLAGNRDPEVFDAPDEVDLARSNAGDHLAFGDGPHVCLGQHLAREEMLAVLPRVVEDFEGLRLAVPFEDLRFRVDQGIYGVCELPLSWDKHGADAM